MHTLAFVRVPISVAVRTLATVRRNPLQLLLASKSLAWPSMDHPQHDVASVAAQCCTVPSRALSMAKSRRKLPPSVHVVSMALSVAITRHLAMQHLLTLLLVCSPSQADNATKRMTALLEATPKAAGLRIGMTNDWGSPTGFTYTLSFVAEAEVLEDDERIELPTRAVLFVERKALWAGEGGLLGATLDLDSNFNLVVSHKGSDAPGPR